MKISSWLPAPIAVIIAIAVGGLVGLLAFHLSNRQGGPALPEVPAPTASQSTGSTRRIPTIHPDEGEVIVWKAALESIGMELVWISAGSFRMGSPADEFARSGDEGPLHQVTISKDFWIGMYEVTQSEWQSVMGSNPSHYNGPRRPVENVSWFEAVEFCRELSRREGKIFRLPTEAEWEYACRAGSDAYRYWELSELNSIAWTTYNAASTKDVGQMIPNPWGLYDIFGNVEEWCSDWKGQYSVGHQIDPVGPATGKLKVVRGGYYRSGNGGCRAAARDGSAPDRKQNSRGFRVVMENPEAKQAATPGTAGR